MYTQSSLRLLSEEFWRELLKGTSYISMKRRHFGVVVVDFVVVVVVILLCLRWFLGESLRNRIDCGFF